MPNPEKREHANGTTSWRVRFRIDRRARTETFFTASAAQNFCDTISVLGPAEAFRILEERRVERTHGRAVNTTTLNEWASRYIDSLTGASESTKAGYRSTYKHSFGQHLGALPLTSISRETIAHAIGKLQKAGGRGNVGYSDKSIANQHGLLSAMFATAVTDGILTANPCDRIRLPRRTAHSDGEKRYLTEEEFALLHSNTLPHHQPVLELLVGTGIRWGEAEALIVADVDVKRGRLRINKAAKWSGEGAGRVIGPTKTVRSRRTIALPVELVDILAQLVGDRPPTDRLLLAPRGGPLKHKTFWEHVWRPACKASGLWDPAPRLHDLRHTHASWLIAEGVSMKAVQERLGHKSIKTTMDLYAHLMPGAQEAAAEAASRALSRALPGRGGIRVVKDPSAA